MITIHLKVGTLRGPLHVERDPIYLRFVMKGSDWKTLDALDHPEDVPHDGEMVYAAKRVARDNVHVDGVKDGRRFGQWIATATYELVSRQPSQAVLRDWSRWQAWAHERWQEESA